MDIVLTGASGGIGSAIYRVLYKEGIFPIVICGTGLIKVTSLLDNETKEELLPLRKFRTRFA